MTVANPQPPILPPGFDGNFEALFKDVGLEPGKVYTDEQFNKIADKIVSSTGKGVAADISEALQSFQDINIPLDEATFKVIVANEIAFVPPPELSELAGGEPVPNDFFLASLNTVLVEMVIEYMQFLKENDVVMGELGVDNMKAMFESAFARAQNEIELGNKQAAKSMVEGIAGLISGVGSMITAGMTLKEVRAAKTQAAEDISRVVTPRQQSLLAEAKSIQPSAGQRAGENGVQPFLNNRSNAGRLRGEIDKEAHELAATQVKIKGEAFGKAVSKGQMYSQISNSIEGISKAVASFTSATYEKEMGQIRAENVILEAGQKAAEQAWNKALDSLFKSNPQDRDAMANFLKELLAASARIGTSNA